MALGAMLEAKLPATSTTKSAAAAGGWHCEDRPNASPQLSASAYTPLALRYYERVRVLFPMIRMCDVGKPQRRIGLVTANGWNS